MGPQMPGRSVAAGPQCLLIFRRKHRPYPFGRPGGALWAHCISHCFSLFFASIAIESIIPPGGVEQHVSGNQQRRGETRSFLAVSVFAFFCLAAIRRPLFSGFATLVNLVALSYRAPIPRNAQRASSPTILRLRGDFCPQGEGLVERVNTESVRQ